MLISRWTQSKGECYNTLFDLIKTSITIEAMKLMVKALITPNVKAIVTAMFIAAVREGIEGLHLC